MCRIIKNYTKLPCRDGHFFFKEPKKYRFWVIIYGNFICHESTPPPGKSPREKLPNKVSKKGPKCDGKSFLSSIGKKVQKNFLIRCQNKAQNVTV